MTKEISIAYRQPSSGSQTAILVKYTVEKTNENLLLTCAVTAAYPYASDWLTLRKFSLRARLENKRYNLLFDDNNFSTTTDVSTFIDHAYKQIMSKEQLQLSA